ncbi:MAG TPA: hypothetical protein VEC19_01230 [Usitatibacter sp.]|nr:hypothetical protein [Usitatibacter sp.]
MRALSEGDGSLVIAGPTWLGLAFIAIAVVLTILVLVLQRPRPVRLGSFLGAIILLVAGWHLIGNKTTLEPRGYYVESIYGEEERRGWLQVRQIVSGGPNTDPDHLVLQLRNSSEATIDLSGLGPAERARVVAFVKKQLTR